MAYATGKSRREQLATAGLVAALHAGIGAALLITFAGGVQQIVTHLTPQAFNVKPDPVPPPPEDPAPPQQVETRTVAPKPELSLASVDPDSLVIPDTGLKPVESHIVISGGTGTKIDPSPSPTSSFVPRSARPKTSPGTWATTIDYPPAELRMEHEGTTAFRVTVGTDGRVTECMIIRSSGYPGLDEATCAKVSKRARFEPATNDAGEKVTGSYANSIRWTIPE